MPIFPSLNLSGLTKAERDWVINGAGLPYETGDILYYDGTKLNRRGIGTAGQVLRVSGGLPVWETLSLASYNQIQEEGVNLVQRSVLNFIGSGITASDNAGGSKTDVALHAQLNALADLATTGLLARTGDNAFATRTLIAGSTKISITNGSGVAGNPVIDVVEANLALNNLGGVLGVAKGGTGLSSIAAGKLLYASAVDTLAELTLGPSLAVAAGILDVQNDTSTQKVEVVKNSGAIIGTRKQLNFIEGSNITLTIADDSVNNQVDITIAASAAAGGYDTIQEEGVSLTQRTIMNFIGSAITAADDAVNARTNISTHAQVNALADLATNGLITRIADNTLNTRSIVAGSTKVSVVNGSGVAGNPTIDVVEDNLTLNNIGGVLDATKGGTGLSTIAANNIIYSSALNTFSATPITAFGRSLIDDADAAAGRATLGAAASGANSDITSLSGLTTPLSISQGGTGQTTANAALNALLPSQAGNAEKFLQTDGTNTSWATVAGGDLVVAAFPGDGLVSQNASFTKDGGTALTWAVVLFPDDGTGVWSFNVKVPKGATSISSIKFYAASPVANGDFVCCFRIAKIDTDVTSALVEDTTQAFITYTTAATANQVAAFSFPTNSYDGLGGIDADDILAVDMQRRPTHANDTLGDKLIVFGVLFTFA